MPSDGVLALLPLIPVFSLIIPLIGNPWEPVIAWIRRDSLPNSNVTVGTQLLTFLIIGSLGYAATNRLVPHIKSYTLRKGISGKDLGKRGTDLGENPVPEALGIVPGAIFLVCLIFCLVGYAAWNPAKLLDMNSALLSVCFMIFLGFTDDVLDWPWRYKLILPTVASLPLLCCYNGSTSILVPKPLRALLSVDGEATLLGNILQHVISIDTNGTLLELGFFYLVYMSMLAVFCTNAINIYAGINGLEAGQAYVIGCAILVHNLIEIRRDSIVQNHLFSVMIMLSFVGVTLGLLRHNWYPANVFVGDTYCYFGGMVFAVVAILGHFSKTLLLFFVPQVVNFLWSTPQLFKFVPCPRHRLPRFDARTGLMHPSTFTCQRHEYRWLKSKANDTEVPNMTVINLCLQWMGPMKERDLCVVLLSLQAISCLFGFWCRYHLSTILFD